MQRCRGCRCHDGVLDAFRIPDISSSKRHAFLPSGISLPLPPNHCRVGCRTPLSVGYALSSGTQNAEPHTSDVRQRLLCVTADTSSHQLAVQFRPPRDGERQTQLVCREFEERGDGVVRGRKKHGPSLFVCQIPSANTDVALAGMTSLLRTQRMHSDTAAALTPLFG